MKYAVNPKDLYVFCFDDAQNVPSHLIEAKEGRPTHRHIPVISDAGTVSWHLDPQSLFDHKERVVTSVDALHSYYFIKSVGSPTQAERDTWDFKASLAKSILIGNAVDVSGEAFLSAAGIAFPDREAWATKVSDKSSVYAAAVGTAEAMRKKHKTAIAAVKNQAELDTLITTIQSDWASLI